MKNFLSRFALSIYGVLTGFDRIRFRGIRRGIAYSQGLDQYLWSQHVLLKDFHAYATQATDTMRRQIEANAHSRGLEIHYVRDSLVAKEKLAAKYAAEAGRKRGLVAILSALEPCRSFIVRKNPKLGRLELQSHASKCLHYYHYWRHPVLGPCHVRMQSWFPFNAFVCVNGREMLALRMQRERMKFRQRDNCFSWVSDVERAQAMLDEQKAMLWSKELQQLLQATHPQWREWPGGEWPGLKDEYYWSAEQTEWATDVMFRSGRELKVLVPRFIEHATTTLGCANVLRFLGHHLNNDGAINGHYRGEVGTDVVRRAEGTRVSFRAGFNSVKFYDKQGSVLRVETTINDPKVFQSYRASERDPEGPKKLRGMKKGVSDLPRRTEVSQAANERCLESLASVAIPKTIAATARRVCRRKVRQGKSVRGLNPLGDDGALLNAIANGEYLLNGFRNRDVRTVLKDLSTSAVAYRLRLLRAHGVIRKVSGTHRYQVTDCGRDLLAAVTKTLKMQLSDDNREKPQ